MRLCIAFLLLFTLPFATSAQERASAPLLVVGENAKPAGSPPSAEQVIAAYPKEAMTEIGAHGRPEPVADPSANPPSPTAPATPPNAAAPASPASPNAPTPPPNPISKLWPRDTVPVFLPTCTGLRPQYVAPCTCVITKLMLAMGHDEFLKKSEDGTLEQDPRLAQIRLDCVTSVKKKDER